MEHEPTHDTLTITQSVALAIGQELMAMHEEGVEPQRVEFDVPTERLLLSGEADEVFMALAASEHLAHHDIAVHSVSVNAFGVLPAVHVVAYL